MKNPPKALQGIDNRSAGHFLGLRKALLTQKCNFVLGAGVSAAVGAPTWKGLLDKISIVVFQHLNTSPNYGITSQKLSIADTEVWEISDAIAKELLEYSPLLVAQLVKNQVKEKDWNYMIRKLIYENTLNANNEAVHSIARLLKLSKYIECIVNFNYDDLFERELSSHGIEYSVLTAEHPTPKRSKLPVYHPHGWLPEKGGAESPLVLSEQDYNDRSHTPYSWSNIVQIAAYCSATSVFIGCSLIDPSLRAILRSTAKIKLTPHWAFLPYTPNVSHEANVFKRLFERDLSLMMIKPIYYPVTDQSGHEKLWQLVDLLGCSIHDETILDKSLP